MNLPPTPGSAPATGQGVAFDARPLTEPVDKNAVREFNRAHGTSDRVVPAVVVMCIIGGFVAMIMAGMIILFAAAANQLGAPVYIMLIIPALVIAGTIFGARALLRMNGTRNKDFRLSRFASANGMSFVPQVVDPPLPGMIFNKGRARIGSELVRGSQPRFVEFGNYRYTTGSGKNQSTVRWGYVAVKLTVPLPNIVLDATGNNSFLGSNLPSRFSKDQRLELEGDFNKYFSLYCPAGYEPDALYLFTPDIMARFIDNAAQMDVEIVDDWLFLYTGREASTLDPATWHWLFTTVAALIDKFEQWARWRDDRLLAAGQQATVSAGIAAPLPAGLAQATASGQVPLPAAPGFVTPPPGVAPPGKRLRTSVNWVAAVFGIIVFGFVLLTQFGVFSSVISNFFGR